MNTWIHCLSDSPAWVRTACFKKLQPQGNTEKWHLEQVRQNLVTEVKKVMKAKGGFACTKILMCLISDTDQCKLGMERVKEEEMRAEETCVCTRNEGGSSAPLCLSWSHHSTLHYYKCPAQQSRKQPPLWLWHTWATTSPLSQDFTPWDQKVSQQKALKSLGKLCILSAWARPRTTTVEITW